MGWVNRNGKPVRATQFGIGKSRPPGGISQAWDRTGSFYTIRCDNRLIRLSEGDWICYDEAGEVIDVQSGGKFTSENILDSSVPDMNAVPEPKVPMFDAVPKTTAEIEAESAPASASAPEPVDEDFDEI